MALIGVRADLDRLQKRWVIGAVAIAFVIHLMFAGVMGWYKIPALELPNYHTAQTGPFTVKSIEVNPSSLKPQEDPTKQLPAAEPPKNPSDFNLDPNQVEKALQTPQPTLAQPTVPEPSKVIAAADLTQNLPMVESNTTQITAEVAKIEPSNTGGPVTTSKLADQLLNSDAGTPQAGGAPVPGAGTTGKLPAFAQLAPGFKTSPPNLAKLPEPVLLRLPSDVLFDFDSSTLKPEADALLSQAVAMITKYPEADIHIDGYSDSYGKPDYNSTLSGQRAEAVQTWLNTRIAQPTYKFHAQGHGSTNFVVPTSGSIDQQQPNRRVEILIQATKS